MPDWFYVNRGVIHGPYASEAHAQAVEASMLALDSALGMSNVVAASVLFCRRGEPAQVLLVKRAPTEENYAGFWSIPGGGIDADETPEQAATRECEEEIGYSPDVLEMYYDTTLERGDHHYTFRSWTDDGFTPELNGEHTAFSWFPIDELPQPLHPGVKATIDKMRAEEAGERLIVGDTASGFKFMAADKSLVGPFGSKALVMRALSLQRGETDRRLAFDKLSMRTKDPDGRLHLAATHISKACVSPYKGSEIAGGEELGLEPEKVYYLLRDPDELAKAAPTFNGLPITIVHTEMDANNHVRKSEKVVGATGSTAKFNAPYLDNAISVWPQEAIDLIESDRQKELSCGYYYRADMTPGIYEGQKYDGVMRDIVGNHVALVEEGRAGPDVMVMDSATKEQTMKKVKLSPVATGLRGALVASLMPKMAKDKKLDLVPVLRNVSLKSLYAADGKTIKPGVIKAIAKAALDAAIPGMEPEAAKASAAGPDDVMLKMLEHIVGESKEVEEAAVEARAALGGENSNPEAEDEPGATAKAAPSDGKRKEMFDALCASGMGEDDANAFVEKFGGAPAETAEDENDDEPAMDEEEKEMISKKAMDSALKAHGASVEKRTMERLRAVHAAAQDVEPWVGRVSGMAHDSAESVYRSALDTLGINVKDVKDSAALKHILHAQPKPGARSQLAKDNTIAMDSAVESDLAKRYPHAAGIGSL